MSDKESMLQPGNSFNFDHDVNSYTKLINILYNSGHKHLINMKRKINITNYCPLYFRSLREIDKMDDSELMRSLSHEFNFNKMFTCDLKQRAANSKEYSRHYFYTHDHKYKLVQITKSERVNCLDLLHDMYEHIKNGLQNEIYDRKER